jgi:hypothetical protein
VATDYELWATQHGGVDAQAVQVLEFIHPKWGSLWVTDYGEKFAATTEGAVAFVAEAVGFEAELPKQTSTTQSEMTLRLDALGGYVMSQIRAMTDAERTVAIGLTWRLYLDTYRAAPQLSPLQFVVTNITATRLVVEFQCAASAFPNIVAGSRYTIDDYPSLAYL